MDVSGLGSEFLEKTQFLRRVSTFDSSSWHSPTIFRLLLLPGSMLETTQLSNPIPKAGFCHSLQTQAREPSISNTHRSTSQSASHPHLPPSTPSHPSPGKHQPLASSFAQWMRPTLGSETESGSELFVCRTLCNPMDCSPARLLCPWNSPGKNTGVGSPILLQESFTT